MVTGRTSRFLKHRLQKVTGWLDANSREHSGRKVTLSKRGVKQAHSLRLNKAFCWATMVSSRSGSCAWVKHHSEASEAVLELRSSQVEPGDSLATCKETGGQGWDVGVLTSLTAPSSGTGITDKLPLSPTSWATATNQLTPTPSTQLSASPARVGEELLESLWFPVTPATNDKTGNHSDSSSVK